MNYSISNDITSGTCSPDKLEKEIKDSGAVLNYTSISISGDVITIYCDAVLDQDTLDAIIRNHEADSLIDEKVARILEIDANTRAIIARGFTFDGNSFSLSVQAQMNWIGLYSFQSLFVFPINVTTLANTAYPLSHDDLVAFIGVGAGVVATAIGTGRALKILVNAAETKEDLSAIVDTR